MTSAENIEQVLARAERSKLIVYDSETNGLDWKRNTVVGHVLTFGPKEEDTFYVPVRHASNNIADPKRFEKALYKTMKGKHIVGHNLKFDVHMVRTTGFRLEAHASKLECTQNNQALIDELQGKFNLEHCCQVMGAPLKKTRIYDVLAQRFGVKSDKNAMAHFWKLPGDDPDGIDYAMGDGVSTWHLRELQHNELEQQSLYDVWALENRVLKTLIRMEATGVRVNEDELERLRAYLQGHIDEATANLPQDFNARSAKQMAAYLISQGVDPATFPRTAPSMRFPNGQNSFTEAWLSTFAVGNAIVDIRKYSNLISTFVDPLRDRHLFNWRVHTTFNQLRSDNYGVVSGRLSSSDPNLQQVPKHHKELAPLFRNCFEPDPDMTWWSNDYKQQEFVVFACYSGTKAILDGYKATPQIDVHRTMANLLNVDRDTKAKRLNLGKLYGMGAEKLAASLGCSLGEAQYYSREWEKSIPTARDFRSVCEQVVKSRSRGPDRVGYVCTFFGRRRRYPSAINAHAAMSGLIQGSCADICKDKMCEVDEYFESEGDKAQLLLQVHDSLDWQEADGSTKLSLEAQRMMQDFSHLRYAKTIGDCPMKIDIGNGKTWKDASL